MRVTVARDVGSRGLGFLAVVAALLPFALAGCGGGMDLYERDPTMSCLSGAGVRVDTRGIDFIASTAGDGALHARFPGNEVIVSFGESVDDAEATERAYRRFAPEQLRRHLGDVLKRDRNAVMRWGVSPTAEHETAVRSCLTA